MVTMDAVFPMRYALRLTIQYSIEKICHGYRVCSQGDRGGTVVKVLCYKWEGPWFDPS